VLRHVAAISAVVSPTVNSYKRLIKEGSMAGFTWAPVFACYANNNLTNSLRIETLPRDLKEALDAFEADPLSEAVMGSAMYKAFLDFKRAD
jgi:glutamine synthetase